MTLWKRRADQQDRYRRELFTGTIVARNSDGTFDVALPGVEEPVRRVRNASTIQFQAGNRVVLHRLAGRDTWQIHAAIGNAAPAQYLVPGAMIDPDPLVYWGDLARGKADPVTVAGYIEANCLTADGMQPVLAAALGGLLAGGQPLIRPDGVGAWYMSRGDDTDPVRSCGAFAYPGAGIGRVRAGAFPVDAGTLAYWKMDEVEAEAPLFDCTGHGHDLTAESMGEGVESDFYGARSFDGYCSYGYGDALPVGGAAQLTIETWVQPDDVGSGPVLVYQNGSMALTVHTDAAHLAFSAYTGAWLLAPLDAYALCDGDWHYIAGVYDGAALRLYLDGALLGSPLATSGPVGQPGQPSMYAGAYHDMTRYLPGRMQEVRISTVARSAVEIAAAWAGRARHEAVSPAVTFPALCRRVMVGAAEAANGGSVAYAVSADGGATWQPALPWQLLTVSTPSATWRVRATLTGRAEVARLGVIGMP